MSDNSVGTQFDEGPDIKPDGGLYRQTNARGNSAACMWKADPDKKWMKERVYRGNTSWSASG
jgi:hypothetical protein